MCSHAEANQRLLATFRASSAKLSSAERKRAAELFHQVAVRVRACLTGRAYDPYDPMFILPGRTGVWPV